MNIFNNLIKDQEITGIGALMWKELGEGPVIVWYEFDIHTRVGIKTIKSKSCETFGYIDKQDQETLKSFRIEYWVARKKIAALIGEEYLQSSTVLEELKTSYDQLSEQYQLLLADLQPVLKRSKSKIVIEGRIQSLETSILQIKTLATA